jgi:hypothetical protein
VDANKQIPPLVHYLAERGKIHQIHMRAIKGGLNHFAEVYPDEGVLDLFKIMRVPSLATTIVCLASQKARLATACARYLPNVTGVLSHHGLPLLAAEGFLKLRHIGYHSVRARLRRRMRVGLR